VVEEFGVLLTLHGRTYITACVQAMSVVLVLNRKLSMCIIADRMEARG